MTVKKKDVENISVQLDSCTLTIKYPDVTYSYWKTRIPYENDNQLSNILMNLLVSLDCSITFSNQRLLYTTHMMYDYHISEYYYYLLHMENQELYNYYFDLLLFRHEENIQFELDNPIIVREVKPKVKTKSKGKVSNKYVKQITTDLITNEEVYIYSNSKTGDTIQSSNPNLLDELNGIKPKKEKKVKYAGVPMTNMTFSFKKKTDD